MTRAGDEILLGFTHALRASGVAVTQDRAQTFLAAAAEVGADNQRACYLAGRATLCSSPDDLVRYDQVFFAYFGAEEALPRPRPRTEPSPVQLALDDDETSAAGDEADSDPVLAQASRTEVLRHRDVAELSAADRHHLATMFAQLRPRAPLRRTFRRQSWHRGDLDLNRTLRRTLQRHGEPGELAFQRPRSRPRRVVLLIDVSGSMRNYADALLRLAHRYTHSIGPVETFTLGTRLTHVTKALQLRDPERALAASGETVPDWSGGTRLGETVQAFVDRWGRRGLARGAVVVIFSDGWERGTPDQLREQMARLHRIAHRVIWVNPHRGKVGYQPVQQGIAAVLPFCDDFVAGHSLAAFEELTRVISEA